jgi:hypothetical protein
MLFHPLQALFEPNANGKECSLYTGYLYGRILLSKDGFSGQSNTYSYRGGRFAIPFVNFWSLCILSKISDCVEFSNKYNL